MSEIRIETTVSHQGDQLPSTSTEAPLTVAGIVAAMQQANRDPEIGMWAGYEQRSQT